MKIIDILNKIANGEEPPKKIKYADEVLEYDGYKIDYVDSDGDGLFNEYAWITELNDEVKILEATITPKEDFFKNLKELGVTEIYKKDNIENNKQDKIEKLEKHKTINGTIDGKPYYIYFYNNDEMGNKINELIDRLNNL